MREMGHIGSRIKMPFDYQPPSLTGMYDKPTLSVHPGSEVISGEKVTFYCRLETATSTFFLLKEGRSSHPQRRYGNMQAEFSMNPVTAVHGGTYRCFGSYNNHVWSLPSEPVTLLVTGEKTPNFPPCPLWNPKWTPTSDERQMGRCREGTTNAITYIYFLEAQFIVHEKEHPPRGIRKGRIERTGRKARGNPKPFFFLVSIIRRYWEHQPHTHRAAIFFWWVTSTSKLGAGIKPMTLKKNGIYFKICWVDSVCHDL